MPPNKLKKFCKISKYLEIYDHEIYQIFDDLCLFPLLRSRHKGVTFLRPMDKSFRKELITATYSQNPEKAVEMIKTLILLDFLPTSESFKGKVIPNSSKFQLVVDKIDGKKVILGSKHSLEVDSAFASLRRGDLSAVYKLNGKGSLPLSGAQVSMDTMERKQVRGGADAARREIGNFVETTYGKGGEYKNVYRVTMACLYRYALKTNDRNLCKNIVDSMCASARASFYTIVEPYAEDTLIYQNFSEIIRQTLLVPKTYTDSCKIFEGQYDATRNEIIKFVYPNRNAAQELVAKNNNSRLTILKNMTHHSIRPELENAYKDKKKMAKDSFTVYCFLSTREEDRDPTYFKNCFCPVVKNIYNNQLSILTHTADIAFTMSVYGNLLKSDAFMYVPFCYGGSDTEDRAGYIHNLPKPTDLTSQFTIEQSYLTQKHGGNNHGWTTGGLENFISGND
jgi:hypothetical protein